MSNVKTVAETSHPASRNGWLDVTRGICILLVVVMHSTLGVAKVTGEEGWMHAVVAWSKPFRMPDFFFLSGFLAASAVAMEWRKFLDRKVVHFAYFYVLWLMIGVVVRNVTTPADVPVEFLTGLVEPFGTLWFIHVLPLFFLTLRLVASRWMLPALGAAAVLHIVAAMNAEGGRYAMGSDLFGAMALDSYALFLVFFLAGYALRQQMTSLVALMQANRRMTLLGLAAWAGAHTIGVQTGVAEVPGLSLVFGIAGGIAIWAVAVLLAGLPVAKALAYAGRNSLPIYLAFSIPMAATRSLILASGVDLDAGWFAFIVAVVAALVPLAMQAALKGSRAGVLFERPVWAHLPGMARRAAPAAISADTARAGAMVGQEA